MRTSVVPLPRAPPWPLGGHRVDRRQLASGGARPEAGQSAVHRLQTVQLCVRLHSCLYGTADRCLYGTVLPGAHGTGEVVFTDLSRSQPIPGRRSYTTLTLDGSLTFLSTRQGL